MDLTRLRLKRRAKLDRQRAIIDPTTDEIPRGRRHCRGSACEREGRRLGRMLAMSLAIMTWWGHTAYCAGKRIHVAVLVADDLRSDVMSVYGGPVPTPNLERLAARGSLLTRATCGYPICHVSRTEMLTGRSMVAEATSGKAIPFSPSWAVWPDVMRQAGWDTIHGGKWHVAGTPTQRGYLATSPMYSSGGAAGRPLTHPTTPTGRAVTGYTGWTFKGEDGKAISEWGVGLTPETDDRIADGAIQAIQRKGDQPLFLHVNFTGPHDPLHWPTKIRNPWRAESIDLPENFRSEHPFDHGNRMGRDETIVPAPRRAKDVQQERAIYYAIVEHLDELVGKILDSIDQTHEPWFIVFTSDQGLALGSHGLMGKQNQYEHTVNAPLIVAGPQIPIGQRFNTQCALRDLFPTCCEIVGLPIPSSVEGKSLLPFLSGDSHENHGYAYGYFTDTQRMVRSDDGWKLVWYPQLARTQIFDTERDPNELRDLSHDQSVGPQRDELWRQLEDWLRSHKDPVIANNAPPFQKSQP